MEMEKMNEVYRKWDAQRPDREKIGRLSALQSNGRPRDGTHGRVVQPPPWKDRRIVEGVKFSGKPRSKNLKMSNLELVPELARFKYEPPGIKVSNLQRPLMGRCCSKCCSVSKTMFYAKGVDNLGMRNILNIPISRSSSIWGRYFSDLTYEYETYVSHKYPNAADIKKTVLQSTRVNTAIQKCVLLETEGCDDRQSEIVKSEKKFKARAVNILKHMATNMSNTLLRFTGWFLLKVLRCFLNGIQVHRGQLQMIKQASKRGVPLIFLPVHHSHLDYILVTYILHHWGLVLPNVAAGDNLNIPLFGCLLRHLGGFFIKRKMDKEEGKKDWLYRASLQTYMEVLLSKNQSLEFFLEGTRSRSGKVFLPKGGLLSIIIDAYMDEVISDAYIVPVSISYEKILDGNFNREQMGNPKVPEAFGKALKAIWGVFSNSYGSVRVDFAQPFSLQEYLQGSQSSSLIFSNMMSALNRSPSNSLVAVRSDTSLYGTDIVVEDQRQMIKGLAEHVMYQCVQSMAIMSTNIVAFLFMTKFRKGVSQQVLVGEVERMTEEILTRGRDCGYKGTPGAVTEHALKLLDHLVVIERQKVTGGHGDALPSLLLTPRLDLPHVFEIQYYGNKVVSVFLWEAILASTIFSMVGPQLDLEMGALQDPGQPLSLSRELLVEKATQLCDLLQFEFILIPPCDDINCHILDTIDKFLISEILIDEEASQPIYTRGGGGGHSWADQFSWQDEEDDDDGVYGGGVHDRRLQLALTSASGVDRVKLGRLRFLQSVLGPLMEGYWMSACNLARLLDRDLPEADYMAATKQYAQDRVRGGLALYAESCAMDTLRNTMKLFGHLNVIDTYLDAENEKMVQLKERYRDQEKLADLIGLIEEFKL